ncbi:ladderlectin-like protein, partial [Leptotrombidium deliense]
MFTEWVYRSYTEMKQYCESIDATMLTIHSRHESYSLRFKFPLETTFLGAQKEGNKWKWFNGQDMSFSDWFPGEPNNYGGNQNCIMFHKKDGKWDDWQCENRLYTVCKPNNCEDFIRKENERINWRLVSYVDWKVNDAIHAKLAEIENMVQRKYYELAVQYYQQMNKTWF